MHTKKSLAILFLWIILFSCLCISISTKRNNKHENSVVSILNITKGMVMSNSTKMSLAISIWIINYCLSHVNCSLFTVVVSLFVMLHSLSFTVCTNKYSSSFFYPILLYLLSLFFLLTFIAYQTYNWPSHTFKNLSPIPSNLNLKLRFNLFVTSPNQSQNVWVSIILYYIIESSIKKIAYLLCVYIYLYLYYIVW